MHYLNEMILICVDLSSNIFTLKPFKSKYVKFATKRIIAPMVQVSIVVK